MWERDMTVVSFPHNLFLWNLSFLLVFKNVTLEVLLIFYS